MAGKQFISAKKAARITGQPVRTVSRFCESHRDSKYVRFEDGIFRIRLDFLVKHFGMAADGPQLAPEANPESPPAPAAPANLISLLEAQLAEKDRQLAAKDTQLGQLIERNREQNNIIYSLEQSKQALETRLSLSLPERPERTEPVRPAADGPRVNYLLVGLSVLLAGLVLIILYGLLLG